MVEGIGNAFVTYFVTSALGILKLKDEIAIPEDIRSRVNDLMLAAQMYGMKADDFNALCADPEWFSYHNPGGTEAAVLVAYLQEHLDDSHYVFPHIPVATVEGARLLAQTLLGQL